MSWLGLWALRNWKAIALVLLIASVLGYTYHKGKQAERDRVQAAQAKEQAQALQHELAASRAALEAAQAARGRNDEVIPKARRATADRIARARGPAAVPPALIFPLRLQPALGSIRLLPM